MKRAIQVQGRVTLPEDTLDKLFQIANKIVVPSKWTLGEVDSRTQPPLAPALHDGSFKSVKLTGITQVSVPG